MSLTEGMFGLGLANTKDWSNLITQSRRYRCANIFVAFVKKLTALRKELREAAGEGAVTLVCGLDDVVWLTNLRGHDNPLYPFFHAYMVVGPDIALLMTDQRKVTAEQAEGLDADGKDILVHLFIEDMDEIRRKLEEGGPNKILLLTEPLCGLDVRERIFRDCIEQYGEINGEESVVLIKPHPRDVLDYRKVFPEYIVLDGKFPMEVLNYIPGLRFRRVISVFTVVHAIRFAEEIVYLGEDFMDNYEPPEMHRQNEMI